MTYSLEYISVWRCLIWLHFCWFSTFFYILFLSVSWTVAQTPIKHHFLIEHDEVFQMDTNKIALIDLDLLLRSAQICKKSTIFGKLRTIIQEGKKETRQMTPFFHLLFELLTICDIHFYIWKMSKFVFMGSPLWSILICKISEFWRWKLWDQNFVPFDSGNIHIKESKEPGFTFSIELWTKFVRSPGLMTLAKSTKI